MKTEQQLIEQRDALHRKYGTMHQSEVAPGDVVQHTLDVMRWSRTKKYPGAGTHLLVPVAW